MFITTFKYVTVYYTTVYYAKPYYTKVYYRSINILVFIHRYIYIYIYIYIVMCCKKNTQMVICEKGFKNCRNCNTKKQVVKLQKCFG